MLKFPTTEILVFLVLHRVDWRAHGNNCDYYYVGQDEKISNIPLSLSAVAIDTPDPSPSTRDIAHHCLWPSDRSNSSEYNQTTRLFKRLDSTLCSSPLETRSKRLYWSSSSTFVCKICLPLFKRARNLSLFRARPVQGLYVLEFSPTLASRAALSAVPARHASTVQPCLGYGVHAEAVIDILEARERCAEYALFTRR